MSTKGIPIPSPTPSPTLSGSVFELALIGDGTGICEPVWVGVLETELAVMLLVKEVDDAEAVDELVADEL